MGWNAAKERSDQVVSRFQSLKDHGDKFVCVFLGDGPEVEERAYNPKTEQFEDYTDAHKAAGIQPSPRFKMNIWVSKEGNGKDVKPLPNGPEVRIFDFNNTQFKPIWVSFEKYEKPGQPPQKWFEVERNGKKGDNKWTVTCLPDHDVTDEERKAVTTLTLHDLKSSGEAAPEVGSYDKQKEKAKATPFTRFIVICAGVASLGWGIHYLLH